MLKLRERGVEIIDQSLIDFEAVDLDQYPETDWIFFYSRRGVRYFFDKVDYSTDYEYGVIGPGTASTFYSTTGRSPKYTGNSKAKDIAETFIKYEKGKSILFVKAQNSLNSVQNLLEGNMDCHELIVYKNTIKEDFIIEKCDLLCFTSPMSVDAYTDKYGIKDELLFSIGHSTHQKIKKKTTLSVYSAEHPSEISLLHRIEEVLNQAS